MVVFEGSKPTKEKEREMTRGMNGTYCFWDDLSRGEQAKILYPDNFLRGLFHTKTIKKV